MRSLLILLALTACAHQGGSTCLPVRTWSVVDQQNAKADLESLSQDSPLWGMMRDYKTMRDEARACSGE